jgi:hypothetical protein
MKLELPAFPDVMPSRLYSWVPIRPGLSFKPLRFLPDLSGYVLLLRVEPGTVIPRHRHTGEVHAYHLTGRRKLLDTGEIVGPGDYVYEPSGNVDSWTVVGDEPLVAFIVIWGAVEYLDEQGDVVKSASAATALETYRRHCETTGGDAPPLAGEDRPVSHAAG